MNNDGVIVAHVVITTQQQNAWKLNSRVFSRICYAKLRVRRLFINKIVFNNFFIAVLLYVHFYFCDKHLKKSYIQE
jgi:hypothetical protein